MKLLFTIAIIAYSFGAYSQTDSTNVALELANTQRALYETGESLSQYHSLTSWGYAMQGVGAAVVLVGAGVNMERDKYNRTHKSYEANNDKTGNVLIFAGAGIGVVGFVLNILAADQIGRAGITLRNNGISISIR